LSSLIETRMIRRSVVRIWRKRTTYLEESDFKMIPNEEALNREGSSFPGGTDMTSIVDILYSSLYQFAVGLTKNESDSADLVQQTFLTFSQRLDQIRDFSKIKHWLFTTLRRHFLLRIRRHKKHPEVQFLSDVHDFPAGDPEAWRSLDARSVQEALLQVDERYRVALELFYLNNLSYKEIVDTLGIPIGTVMSRLSRGKAQLKSILWDKFYGDGRMQRMRGSDIPKR
jgi:RNA polymerase sigma-70 factor, ECF subfamily